MNQLQLAEKELDDKTVISDHRDMVASLAKSGEDILASLQPLKCDLLHAVIGISGEAGELLDAVKKHVIYEKPLDRENVIEELGDIEFYLEQLRHNLDISRIDTLKHNLTKLVKRYPGYRYTNQAAQVRQDKGVCCSRCGKNIPADCVVYALDTERFCGACKY